MCIIDLISGVVKVEAPNGFPLESLPPQGMVLVTFATGVQKEMWSNEEEYEQALKMLAK